MALREKDKSQEESMAETLFERLKQAWSADSDLYDTHVRKQLGNKRDVRHWERELQSVLGEKPLDVLDVGCGPGFFSIILGRLGHRVTSVDGAEGMVEVAKRNIAAAGLEAKVLLADAVSLNTFPPRSFDAIVSRDVVWTIYDPPKAFTRWKEALREGGMVVIYDGNYRQDHSSMRYYSLKLAADLIKWCTEGPAPKESCHNTPGLGFEELPLVRKERPREDKEMLQNAGYSRIEVCPDRFRNTPLRSEFWKYGYQGKKFRIIAYK
jgi:SAM-dependent methyltransferase